MCLYVVIYVLCMPRSSVGWMGLTATLPSVAKASNLVRLHRLPRYGYEVTVNGLKPPPSLRVTHSHFNVTG